MADLSMGTPFAGARSYGGLGRHLQAFTLCLPCCAMIAGHRVARIGAKIMTVAIAAGMFILLFGWGGDYFGWEDSSGKVQLALFTTFVLGIICGFKSKG